VVLVADRLEGGPVSSRVSTFPDVFSVAKGGLVQQVHDIAHDAGGNLDIVCLCGNLPSPSVDVHEIGLSEHRLLCWTAPFSRLDPVYLTGD